jgi:hypothetical protein
MIINDSDLIKLTEDYLLESPNIHLEKCIIGIKLQCNQFGFEIFKTLRDALIGLKFCVDYYYSKDTDLLLKSPFDWLKDDNLKAIYSIDLNDVISFKV